MNNLWCMINSDCSFPTLPEGGGGSKRSSSLRDDAVRLGAGGETIDFSWNFNERNCNPSHLYNFRSLFLVFLTTLEIFLFCYSEDQRLGAEHHFINSFPHSDLSYNKVYRYRRVCGKVSYCAFWSSQDPLSGTLFLEMCSVFHANLSTLSSDQQSSLPISWCFQDDWRDRKERRYPHSTSSFLLLT